MTRSDVEDILRVVLPAADDGRGDEAWAALTPLIDAASSQAEAAWGLGIALAHPVFPVDQRLPLATRLLDRWSDPAVLVVLAEATETLRPYSYLNDPPPESPFFVTLAERLKKRVAHATGAPKEARLHEAMATVARVLGRSWDDIAETSHQRAIALRPRRWRGHYNFGLFLKTRGRFQEATEANRKAATLAGRPIESVEWNLAICATGAGDGATAHEVWTRMGDSLKRDGDGLPEGHYHSVQVRLAEHPLAARSAEGDHPGREETIWVERLSPCHGRVQSALYYDLGVDYGDLVLFDGAPILHRRWEDRVVPVFPHLVTLQRSEWRIFRFVGIQARDGQIDDLAARLQDDAVLYVHTEAVEREQTVVRGKLCISPDVDPSRVVIRLDEATEAVDGFSVLAPELHEALGDGDRAASERNRFELLADAE